MTSQLTYLLDAVLGRSAVKFAGKPSASHMKDPCEFCPNNHTPSATVAFGADVDLIFLCNNCLALVNNFDIEGMAEKVRFEITADDGPYPWWLWKKECYRRELSIKLAAMDIANSYFRSLLPTTRSTEGITP